ncbi:flagellar biosynthetic protein FliO [Pseudomonas wadenswilerensis]|uniref:flagellar biosynthetic protein FliO n=1 Tax=Pseudomonas sp. JV241A TaxID=2078785 RepID=UPI001F02C58A|nr:MULTISPECIES: flagellar biosynthetic protein FliO [Pseudomonas]MCE5982466.1 flagellar biosynthetic protein FliO [Pseudomonas sp. LF19]UVM24535.1 flagellar biosynthetic protein FliO [Pseudomonas wadenswilerensis]
MATTQPAAAVVAPVAASGSAAGQLTQLVLGLLLVLGLIFLLAWLLRRVQNAAPGSAQVIEILGSRSLGPRDRLLLIQVGKEQILIGHSPGTIEALHVMAEPIEVPASARQATPEFAQRLMELMGKDQKGRS